MHTESSLLAHLVPRLTRNVEDAATDALAFILNKSEECRGALEKLLSDQSGEQGFALSPLTRFQTQLNFEGGWIPDMVGYDRSGAVRLVEESKFWAALLEGQVCGYLNLLAAPGPGGAAVHRAGHPDRDPVGRDRARVDHLPQSGLPEISRSRRGSRP